MATQVDDDAGDDRVRIAEDACLFGFPLVLMETTRRIISNVPAGRKPGFGPMNWFTHMRAPYRRRWGDPGGGVSWPPWQLASSLMS